MLHVKETQHQQVGGRWREREGRDGEHTQVCGSVGGWQYHCCWHVATIVFGRETGIIINALIMDFPFIAILKLITCMSHMDNHIIKLL